MREDIDVGTSEEIPTPVTHEEGKAERVAVNDGDREEKVVAYNSPNRLENLLKGYDMGNSPDIEAPNVFKIQPVRLGTSNDIFGGAAGAGTRKFWRTRPRSQRPRRSAPPGQPTTALSARY